MVFNNQVRTLCRIESACLRVRSSYNSAVISGWYDTCATLPRDSVPADLDSYAPTRIMCDLQNGRIVHIAVYCDDEQTPRFTLNLQSEP